MKPVYSSDGGPSLEQAGLFLARPHNSHCAVLAWKSAGSLTKHHTKPDVVVPVFGIVPVAIRRAKIPGIVVP